MKKENITLKKAIFMTLAALAVTTMLLGQDFLTKFNGTWKSENGKQVRMLTVKGGVIYMEEDNAGRAGKILRQYPTNGELVMPDDYGVWAKAKAKGHIEGNKIIVDTETETFGNWHDEWTMSADGKTYQALRVSMGGGRGGKAGPGGGKGKAAPEPETFTKQ